MGTTTEETTTDTYDEQLADRLRNFFSTRRRANAHFNVAPRYTPGSPAMVPEDIAIRVAVQERSSHQRALDGLYGPTRQREALEKGLAGIVDVRRELPRGKGWDILDLCTLERREEPFQKGARA